MLLQPEKVPYFETKCILMLFCATKIKTKSRWSNPGVVFFFYFPIITLWRQTFCRPMLYNTMQVIWTPVNLSCVFCSTISIVPYFMHRCKGGGVTNRTSYMNLLYILISTPPQDLCWIFFLISFLFVLRMFIHLTNNANNFVVVMNVFSECFDQCNIFVNI